MVQLGQRVRPQADRRRFRRRVRRAGRRGDHLMDGPLLFDHLTVVELATDPAGEMVGKVLAEMGADVVKIEPPAGAPSRSVGPFVTGRTDGDHSLSFWYYNTNKRSAVLDYSTPAGRDELLSLLAGADVCITTLRPPE